MTHLYHNIRWVHKDRVSMTEGGGMWVRLEMLQENKMKIGCKQWSLRPSICKYNDTDCATVWLAKGCISGFPSYM